MRRTSRAPRGASVRAPARTGASVVLGAWILALGGGCLSVRTPGPGPLELAAGEGLVLGRVRVFERGLELTPWSRGLDEILAEDPVVRLALFQVESGRKRPDVPLRADGRFAWILPAGTYLLYHTPSIEPPFNEPLAAFQVAAGPDPVDLGELRLAVSVDRPLSWELATYSLVGVEAAAGDGAGAAELRRLHPGAYTVREGAFVVDPALGELFTNWSRAACERILARHGLEIGPPEGG